MSTEPSELDIDLNLPDHTKQLYEAEQYIKDIKTQVLLCQEEKKIDDKTYNKLHDKITDILYYVGELSMPAFNVHEKLEDEYFNVYKHAPELAKKLWLDHYNRLHRPYNILKNRLFRMYEILDETYKEVYGEYPKI